jgi:leucyl-tRNA synthetase
LLFCGPWEEGGDFNDAGLAGIERFSKRIWRVLTEPHRPGPGIDDLVVVDRAIRDVESDIERLKFNTALAALMELVRWGMQAKEAMTTVQWQTFARVTTLLLAPFAPHLAEELWERSGGPYSVHFQRWPSYDRRALAEEVISLVVQVDDRVRDVISAPAGLSRDQAIQTAMRSPKVVRHLGGGSPARTVYVADRLLNLLTDPQR